MKKLFLSICVMTFIACGNKENKTSETAGETSTSVEEVAASEHGDEATHKHDEAHEHGENKDNTTATKAVKIGDYLAYGKIMSADKALSSAQIDQKIQTLEVGDTLNVKFRATSTEVCQKMGCWMKVNLVAGQDNMVKFKDHSFFVPKDSNGKEVVVKGKAFIKEVSVKELRHFAEDAGKSKEEIDAIIEPEQSVAFVADGVMIRQ